jgi:hypothetical protein
LLSDIPVPERLIVSLIDIPLEICLFEVLENVWEFNEMVKEQKINTK